MIPKMEQKMTLRIKKLERKKKIKCSANGEAESYMERNKKKAAKVIQDQNSNEKNSKHTRKKCKA